MLKKSKQCLILLVITALVMLCALPGAALASTSSGSKTVKLDAPKITSIKASGKNVTIRWSKVKGAEKYKIYRWVKYNKWVYKKTVKKTAANKAKYSDTSKYKLKVKNGKYRVYRKTTAHKWRRLKTQTSRKYVFKGKYDKKYKFAVKAVKGKTESKYSKARSIRTEADKAPEILPPEDDDTDSWDKEKEAEYRDNLNGDLKDTTAAVRAVSLELYKELAEKDVDKGVNTMISPVSFMAAMGLLRNGAKGDTLKEINKAFDTSTEDFNTWFANWNGMAELKGSTLKLANSVWARDSEDLEVYGSYKDKVSENYNAEMFTEPFDNSTVKKVNNWVSDKTDKMIPSIIDDLYEDTEMILLNATCFKGKWVEPFNEYSTKKDQTFTREDGKTEKADMMRCSESRYFENDKLTGTFKSYLKGYKIMFMLPKEGVTVKEALGSLKGDALHELEESAGQAVVHLTVPKFEFDYTAPDCIASLKDMGIRTVFDPDKADLTGMARSKQGDNLYVSDIIHKTHIDLNENGTDAAAATAIIIDKNTSVFEPEIKEVCLDRPFIFAIMDDATSTPIFMGTVMSIG